MLKALTILQARNVIALAHAYLGRGHHGAVDDRGAHLENPNKRALYQGIKQLSSAQRRELTALMWIGRGIYQSTEWPAACRYARANQKDSDLLYMIENGPLGEQLERGLERLEPAGASEQPEARCAA